MASNISTNLSNSCSLSLLWNSSSFEIRKSTLLVCIIATITHSLFWLQLILFPFVRQKAMQWLYAYLITDILLLFRFFLVYIVRTTSSECTLNIAWYFFVCYFEAFVDTYLNATEVYILLALNLCRYAQIVRNKNVYVTHLKLLTLTHLAIYLMPIINFVVQVAVNWAGLIIVSGDSCSIHYTNIYIQVFNTTFIFALPIGLNILVIYASIRYVHLTSRLRRTQHHVSAREKYNRSLVTQFFIFYIVWLLLWSPNVILSQFTTKYEVIRVFRLLNFIEIAIDPLIIGALDVRFWQIWRNMWRKLRNRYFPQLHPRRKQVQPIVTIPLSQR